MASGGEIPAQVHGNLWILPDEPPSYGIRFTPEARRRIIEVLSTNDPAIADDLELIYLVGSDEDPEDKDWRALEECLTELLAPPVRYVLGVDQRDDLCQRCRTNARHGGDFLCASCRVDGDPHG